MIFIYDDTLTVPDDVGAALGIASFGNLLYKKKQLKKHLLERMSDLGIHRVVDLNNKTDAERLINELQMEGSDRKVLYYPSNIFPTNFSKFDVFIKKIAYSDQDLLVSNAVDSLPLILMSAKSFHAYWYQVRLGTLHPKMFFEQHDYTALPHEDYFLYLKNYQTVHELLSNHYEARYFNTVSSDQYYATKCSKDKVKLCREFNYHHLLPEEMKIFFVRPFSFVEQEDSASYRMERLNIPDFSVQWVHDAVNQEEFGRFLETAFYFLTHRPSKPVAKTEFLQTHHNYYSKKLDDRLAQLEQLPCYAALNKLISAGTSYSTIKDIAALNHDLLSTAAKNRESYLAISHGDFCFSNILYDKKTQLFKLIDPRGAMTEAELYLDPYYDVAKLSHSILGGYDYINNALYEITFNDNLSLQLKLYAHNQTQLQNLFKDQLARVGFDYELVRIYEASLFLSMLPLHVDNLQKTLAFVLTAIRILEELQ